MSEVREGLVENDDGFDLVLADQKEKVRVIYSVCSLVVPTLEEAILTSVLKKNFK